jgi:hypothetical protein
MGRESSRALKLENAAETTREEMKRKEEVRETGTDGLSLQKANVWETPTSDRENDQGEATGSDSESESEATTAIIGHTETEGGEKA